MNLDLKEELIKYSTLELNVSNNLTFLLYNHSSMSGSALSDSILSLINQLEVNSKHFNKILDTIQDNILN